MNNKLEELWNAAKLGELLHKKETMEKKRTNALLTILAVIGAVAAVAAIAYAVYRYFTPDYLEDFEDDFDDDDFDDDELDICDCSSMKDDTKTDAPADDFVSDAE